jgi:hypothetical protein
VRNLYSNLYSMTTKLEAIGRPFGKSYTFIWVMNLVTR